MKTFTTEEIRDLYNQVALGKISFSRMAKMINQRMNETSEPQYKDGDFVTNVTGSVLIFREKDGSYIYDHAYFNEMAGMTSFSNLPTLSPIERYATEEEKQKMLDALTKKGKRWNEKKKCIEDIPIKLKNGDFVVGFGCVFILYTQIAKHSAQYHVLYSKTNGNLYYYSSNTQLGNIQKLRLATEEEKQELLDALEKHGKQWNAEKLRIEDIPQRKFKPGDKVKLKDGVLHRGGKYPHFEEDMRVLIGKVLTVGSCTSKGYLYLNEGNGWIFAEDWFEPYEELKRGDLAIFWDKVKRHAIITFYDRLDEDETYLQHKDIAGSGWENAIKFESKEQFEQFIKENI